MRRVTVAIGVVVLVAALILGYFLFGEDDRAPTPVAEAERSAPAVEDAAPPPPPPPQAAAEPAAEQTAAKPDSEAAEPEAAPQQPVIMVKPRPPAPPAASPAPGTATSAAPAAPAAPKAETPQVSVQIPSETPTPSAPPAAEPAAAEPAAEAPSFDVVRVERSGETVIAGRAEPESEVNVTTQTGETLGRARADSSGAWAIVTEQPLAPGSHEIGVESEGTKGEKRLSEEVVVVVVPEPAKATAPATAPAAAPQPKAPDTQVLAVLTPRQGEGASKVLPQQQQTEEGIVQGDLVLDSVDYDETGKVTVGGRAAPGSRLLIYLDNRLVGDTVAGRDGRWEYSLEQPVAEGLHSLRVDQVDAGGSVLARVETPFSREAVRVPEAGEEFVIVQPGNSLWRIARRTYGQGIRYTVIYQANVDQIRDPDLIYPGQVFELPEIN